MHRLTFTVFASVLSASLLLAGCQKKEPVDMAASRYRAFCGEYNGSVSDPCYLSMYALGANADVFDGKVVTVAGFYTKGLGHVLFFNRESSEYGVIKNGVLLSGVSKDTEMKLANSDNSYLVVTGLFKRPKMAKSEFERAESKGFSGELTNIRLVRGSNVGLPYACWDPANPDGDRANMVRSVLGEHPCS